MKVLVVDDENIKRITLRDDLADAGYEVFDATDAETALEIFRERSPEVVVTDVQMPGMNGIEFLRKVKSQDPDCFVVVMTGYGTVETAVEAIHEGAYDYITKPFSSDKLILILKRVDEIFRLRSENQMLHQRLQEGAGPPVMVGHSQLVRDLREQIQRVAQTDSPVLIQGETGVGKDMAARMIHNLSPRSRRPFIKVSCAMYSVTMLESELFGHEKGAFTGAAQSRAGRFESAESGTVYLDEIDDVPLELQVKLLHVLEDGVIERVGSTKSVPFRARVVTASKVDLDRLLAEGKFRRDLFFRLNVLSLRLPPLRDYIEDLPYLITHFLLSFGQPANSFNFTQPALEKIKQYHWPGNVRELRNFVERLLILSPGRDIEPGDIEFPGQGQEASAKEGDAMPAIEEDATFDEQMRAFESRLLSSALDKAGGNQSKAADDLGMKLSTFRDKVKKHSLI